MLPNNYVHFFFTFLLSLLQFSQTVTGQRTPTISQISQEKIKDIGSSVDLECSVQYAEEFPVLWMKLTNNGDLLPLSNKGNLIVKDSRFSMRHDVATSSYVLQIKDIQETDAGLYSCRINIDLQNNIEARVNLLVRRAPYISDNSTRSQIVGEGDPVTLECYADGFPKPMIRWRRHNNAILPTGGISLTGNILSIPSVRKEDRGTYYCIADNRVGRSDQRHVNLEVEFAPVVTALRPRVSQALHYDMNLECHVIGFPQPAITWLKDDKVLLNNQHQSISEFANADEYTDTTLRVITIEKRQFGKYICKAANKLGFNETAVELVESIVPVCPPACYNKQSAGTSIAPFGAVITFILFITALFKNFGTKH